MTTEGGLWFHTQSPPTMMDSYLYTQRVRSGDLSSDALKSKINRKDFELVILDWDVVNGTPPTYEDSWFFPADIVDAISRNYSLGRKLYHYYLYLPNDNAVAPPDGL